MNASEGMCEIEFLKQRGIIQEFGLGKVNPIINLYIN